MSNRDALTCCVASRLTSISTGTCLNFASIPTGTVHPLGSTGNANHYEHLASLAFPDGQVGCTHFGP
jgi:hypothetical protein